MTLLESRPFRSVVLVRRARGLVVLKRFHHPHPLRARRDRARARREFEILRRLEQAGIPVPHAYAVRAVEHGWELELAPVEGATTLEHLFQSRATPPGGWARLVARLGRLLAQLQLAGCRHRDLHAGNLLVDAHGGPWLIDVQRARRAPPDSGERLDEVVECAAVARECLPARLRARFLVAWRAELPDGLRPELCGASLARAIEQRAQARREAQVRSGLGRWLRESSRVRAALLDGQRAWLRRTERAEGSSERIVLRGDPCELQARWLGAARLHEHGLAVALPSVFVLGSPWSARGAWAAFEVPLRLEPSWETLAATLADRGLRLSAPAVAHTRGGLYLLPPREPEDFAESPLMA